MLKKTNFSIILILALAMIVTSCTQDSILDIE